MTIETFQLNGCKFVADDKGFRIEKVARTMFAAETVEKFEVEKYIAIVSVLSNKAIKILRTEKTSKGFSFGCSVEDGTLNDVIKALPNFKKLLSIDSYRFKSYVDSAQLFHRSLLLKDIDFSVAFSLLVFSLENMSNRLYGMNNKKAHLVRFAKHYVAVEERFLKNEIRQLEFNDRVKMETLFKKLLYQSYQMRCNFVHDAKNVSLLSQIAERLAMAFISNDGVQLFPSYSWLRRVTHIALKRFLEQDESKGSNSVESYLDDYEIARFKVRETPIENGQPLTENEVYLQRLSGF